MPQAQHDIAFLWKRPDGTVCLLSRRGGSLYLIVESQGKTVKQQSVESPREAMTLAEEWKRGAVA
jgi:hypothetical protein